MSPMCSITALNPAVFTIKSSPGIELSKIDTDFICAGIYADSTFLPSTVIAEVKSGDPE